MKSLPNNDIALYDRNTGEKGLSDWWVKSGSVGGASFSGNPKKYTVTFASGFSYPDTTYIISIDSEDARTWTFESKTTTGFTINANANQTFTGEVHWKTKKAGE